MARHLVCITFDFDTVALWLARPALPETRGRAVGVAAGIAVFSLLALHYVWTRLP